MKLTEKARRAKGFFRKRVSKIKIASSPEGENIFRMRKNLFLLSCLAVSGVGCVGPGLSSDISREEAVALYGGGIAESVWLERLDTIARILPMPNTKSVQLADGFLFYETEIHEGIEWVANVIPPADAPETLKKLAKSLRKPELPPVEFELSGKVLTRGGVPADETGLRRLAENNATLPPSQRAEIKIFVQAEVLAADLSNALEMLKKCGLADVDVVYLSAR